jgi:hypothetical protein
MPSEVWHHADLPRWRRSAGSSAASDQEADEPNAFVDFLDSELLAGQHGRDVDPLAMQAEPTASGDENV